jgi:hypothetical protein
MPKDEVKARLAPIPVYTVANPKNEFVLVAGEVRFLQSRDGEGRSSGHFSWQAAVLVVGGRIW